MEYSLRPYQDAAVRAGIETLKSGGKSIAVLPTGSGKSLVIASVAREMTGNTIVFQPNKEILEQNLQKMIDFGFGGDTAVFSASLGRKEVGKITLATIGSIYNRPELWTVFDHAIIDECFIAGTKISTPNGSVDIDSVRSGDTILSAIGWQSVLGVSSRKTDVLFSLEFSDGTKITCTSNHRFFTRDGWKAAGDMDIGNVAFSEEGLRFLWKSVLPVEEGCRYGESRQSAEYEILGDAELLLSLLWEEIEKSNALEVVEGEDGTDTSEDRTQTDKKGGERVIIASTSTCASPRIGGWVGSGSKHSDREKQVEWVSNMLQSRHWERGKENCGRGGRRIALHDEKQGSRRKKDSTTLFPRVVSVSRIKSTCPRTVYNLHVSGHPSYFANGKLVHNCHTVNADGGMYKDFITAHDGSVFGLTATPYRLHQYSDGYGENYVVAKFLNRTRPRVFKDICHVTQISEMYNLGFLAPVEYTINDAYKHSALRLNSTGMDFDDKSLKLYNEQMNIVGLVAKAIRKDGSKHILVFNKFVFEAEQLAAELARAGITSASVSAETPKAERTQILSDFRAGKIRVVTNVGVLTTGFDFPALDCIILARPTQSVALYYQMIGRGVRIAPNKTRVRVIDVCGNVPRFGRIESFSIVADTERQNLVRLRSDASFLTGFDFVHGVDVEQIGYKGLSEMISNAKKEEARRSREAVKKQLAAEGKVTFGKYQGQPIADVPDGYLQWVIENFDKGAKRAVFEVEWQKRCEARTTALPFQA